MSEPMVSDPGQVGPGVPVCHPETYPGLCRGGPLDGQVMISRLPAGFRLVDKPAGRSWLYQWMGDGDWGRDAEWAGDVVPTGVFQITDAAGAPIDKDQRIEALDEQEYDVVAAPWVDA